MKVMTLHLPDELHIELKAYAVAKKTTMREIITAQLESFFKHKKPRR